MKSDAALLADWLNISAFVKDMIFQLLVKGDAVGFKRYTKDAKDLDRGHMRQSGFHEGQVRPGDRWWRPDNPVVGEGLELGTTG